MRARFNPEKFDRFDHSLHEAVLEESKVEHVSHCSFTDDFGNDFLALVQLYNLLVALVIKCLDDAFKRLLYLDH